MSGAGTDGDQEQRDTAAAADAAGSGAQTPHPELSMSVQPYGLRQLPGLPGEPCSDNLWDSFPLDRIRLIASLNLGCYRGTFRRNILC